MSERSHGSRGAVDPDGRGGTPDGNGAPATIRLANQTAAGGPGPADDANAAPLLGTVLLDELVALVLREAAAPGQFEAALAASPAATLPWLLAGDFAAGPAKALVGAVERCRAAAPDTAAAAGALACLLALASGGHFLPGLPTRLLEGAFLELSALPAPWGPRFLAAAAAAAAAPAPPAAGEPDGPGLHRVGRYSIVAKLGQGSSGTVYRARQQGTDRDVALKLLRGDAMTPEQLARFQREAVLLGRLDHPAIARVYDSGLAQVHGDTVPFLALELVEGEHLIAHAAAVRLTDAQRIDLVRQVAGAVQHAHEQGIVHRDLSPANVLVGRCGRPKVIDFGIARILDAGRHGSVQHTRTGEVIGTPAYMSPEQAAGDPERVGAAADVWTLGVLLFELLTGSLPLPVAGRPLAEVLRTLADAEPRRLRSLRADLGADLDAVVGKALEREPADRYASAGAFADDLALVLAGAPVTVRAPTRLERAGRFVRRHKKLVAAVSAVVVLQAAALVFAVRGWQYAANTVDTLGDVVESALATADVSERTGAPTEKYREMLEKLERALPGLRDLPDPRHYEKVAAFLCEQVGDGRMREHQPAEAEQCFRECIEHCEALIGLAPEAIAPRAKLATAMAKLGNARRDLGSIEEAEQLFWRAQRLVEQLCAEAPGDDELLDDFAWCWHRLGNAALNRGDNDAACERYAHALRAMRRAYAARPDDEDRVFGIGHMHLDLGCILRQLGAPAAEIEPLLRTARDHAAVLARLHPDNPDYAGFLRNAPAVFAEWLLAQGRPAAVQPLLEDAIAVSRRWVAFGIRDQSMRDGLANMHLLLANVRMAAGELDGAATALAQAGQAQAESAAACPERARNWMAVVLRYEGELALARGNRAEAARQWREALAAPGILTEDGAGVLTRLVRHGMADAAEREKLEQWMGQLRQSSDPMAVRRRIDLHELLGETQQAEVLRAGLEAAAQPAVERVRAILAGAQ